LLWSDGGDVPTVAPFALHRDNPMKAREARQLKAKVDDLVKRGEAAQAKAVIERTPGALAHGRLRNAYRDVLLMLGDAEAAEAFHLETVLSDPANRYALSTFLSANKGRPESDATLAKYVLIAEETGNPAVRARVATILLGRGEIDAAWQHADSALTAAEDPAQRTILRATVASLFRWYGRLDLADALILRHADRTHPLAPFWEATKLRNRVVPNQATRARLEYFAEIDSPYRDEARMTLLNFIWSNEGASMELFSRTASWTQDASDPVALQAERIALAAELDRDDLALDLLKRWPACSSAYDVVLPIARLLAENPTLASPDIAMADVEATAAVFDRLLLDSADLASWLSDPTRSVAIVGNSPCELGLGMGHLIDSHDIVIRFNRAGAEPSFKADYGAKTDVHILPIGGETEGPPAADARYVLLTAPSVPFRNRRWQHVRNLMRSKRVGCIRADSYHAMVARLAAEPSNGIRVCAYVAALRPGVRRVSTFGFAFIDQIGPKPQSSHYFERTTPSLHHKWQEERRIFEDLFGEIGSARKQSGDRRRS
jgi:tetratricopeptide (TPR) repeat protein